jgi:hypothetical protein
MLVSGYSVMRTFRLGVRTLDRQARCCDDHRPTNIPRHEYNDIVHRMVNRPPSASIEHRDLEASATSCRIRRSVVSVRMASPFASTAESPRSRLTSRGSSPSRPLPQDSVAHCAVASLS